MLHPSLVCAIKGVRVIDFRWETRNIEETINSDPFDLGIIMGLLIDISMSVVQCFSESKEIQDFSWLFTWDHFSKLTFSESVFSFLGILMAMLGAAFGGISIIQHYCLRTILWIDGQIPLRFVRFLNKVTQTKILHRVGGKYSFLHPLLQQYFSASARRSEDQSKKFEW